MLEFLLNVMDRHPRICQTVWLAMLLGACLLLPRLQIEDSPERWMPKSTSQAWAEFDSHFDVGDTIGVGLVYRRPLVDGDLASLKRLRHKLAAIAGMKQVYDVSLVAEEIEAVPLTTLLDPAKSDRFGLYEGALWGAALPNQTEWTLMTVCELVYYPESKAAELNAIRRNAVVEVYQIVAEARRDPDFAQVQFHVASGIVMMVELEKRAREVALSFLPLSVLIGLSSLLLGFRSIRALAVAVLGGSAAMILVLGVVAASSGRLGVVAMAAPSLMSIVAIATTVHFASHTADAGGFDPADPRQRAELVRWVGVPAFGSALTTGVGFLMLAYNELDPVRDLGIQLFAGAVLAFVGVFIASQALPIRTAYRGRFLTHAPFGAWCEWVTAWPRATTAAAILLMAVLAHGAWPFLIPHESIGLKVDADPFSFFGPEQPITQARDHFAKCQLGIYQLEVVLIPKHPGTPGDGLRPGDREFEANQQAAREYSKKITDRTDLGVLRVVSTQAFQERQRKFYQETWRVMNEQGPAAAAARVYRLSKHLAMFNDTFQSWNRDQAGQGALRLTFLVRDQGLQGFGPLLELAERELPRERFECHVTGAVAMVVHLSQGLITGMMSGLGTSLLVMAGLCTLLFRSPRLAAIAFLPNAFPIIVVYGMMGYTGLPISSGSAMVATVALGIALNDTIHFLLHYKKLTREQGQSTEAALHATFEHLGRPIVLTSAVHIAGFTIFLWTDFLPLYHFGLLSAIAMVAALAGDVVLLPNLLRVFDPRSGRT